MERLSESLKLHWPDGLNLLLGVWLVVSPWILGFTGVKYAPGNAYVVGVIIAVAAVSALLAFHEWEEWVNIILGVWLVITPWLFGFGTLAPTTETLAAFAATWNFVIVGLLVVGLAAWSAIIMRKHGQPAT
jgi:hypothetical protein